MSGFPTEQQPPSGHGWPRVQVHAGTGVVDRRRDTLLVVPVLSASSVERVRELLEVCHRPEPTGRHRLSAARALVRGRPVADLPGFALLVRSGHSLRVLVHGPVGVLVDGRRAAAATGDDAPAELVVEDGTWHDLTVAATGDAAPPGASDVLSLDLETGGVPGAGVTLHRVPAGRAEPPPPAAGMATSTTQLRPAVRFRSVLLGESSAPDPGGGLAPGRRPPLPVAGAGDDRTVGAGTRAPDVLVEGVSCPSGHFTDPDLATCLTCGTPVPSDARRVSRPRPPLGLLVTDGGAIYPVTGDFVLGREPEQAPDVVVGRARPIPLRDEARSTSRVHALLTVRGWTVLLRDNRSANGTFLSRSGAGGPWLPVTAHPPVALVHGDRVRLGQRQMLFDAWREAVVPQVFQ